MEGGQERPLCKGDFGTDRTMQIPGRGVFLDRWHSKWRRSMHVTFPRNVIEAELARGRAVEMVGELKGSQWRESAGKDQAGPGWLNKGLAIYPEWEGQWKSCRGWCQLLSEEMISSRSGSKETSFWGCCKDLGQGSVNLFLKELASKCFWLWRPYGLRGNYSTLWLYCESSQGQYVNKWAWPDLFLPLSWL